MRSNFLYTLGLTLCLASSPLLAAEQTVNIGTSANSGGGDPLRTAFGKINSNFDDLYACNALTVGSGLTKTGCALSMAATGVWVGRQVLAATGTYTPTAGTNAVDVQCVGGGGAGGGTPATGAGQASVGGGGAAGGYLRKRMTSGFSAAPITIGGAGTPNSGASGGAGGNTTFGATLTANGGAGGLVGVLTVPGAVGGSAGGTATGGDINIAGQNGSAAGIYLATIAMSGTGGSSFIGEGGPTRGSLAGFNSGAPGTGYGAGGGGGFALASQVATTGGTPTPGICIVDEYR